MKPLLFSVALLATWANVGFAQTKEIQKQVDKQLKDLRTEDELLRQALASHPDVMVAQAKRQVAEAELAQVKLAVAQKQSKLKSELVIEENTLRAARITLDRMMEMRKKGVVNEQEVLNAETKVQFAQAKLSHISTELQELMPDQKKSAIQHPDVRVATAKLQVADAELAQTKLVLSQKIATLKAEIDAEKQKLALCEMACNHHLKAQQAGTAPIAELMPAQFRLLESRTALTRLNSELKSMTELRPSQAEARPAINQYMGDATGGIGDLPLVSQFLLKSSAAANRPAGSAAEKLAAVLDKKVKFEAKAQPAADIIKSLKEKFGLDLMIRMPLLESDNHGISIVSVNPGEMTFTTWLELILDDLNSAFNDRDTKFVVYVREYGLLIAPEKLVPQDAVTLKEFARQVRAEKVREKEKRKAPTEQLKP